MTDSDFINKCKMSIHEIMESHLAVFCIRATGDVIYITILSVDGCLSGEGFGRKILHGESPCAEGHISNRCLITPLILSGAGSGADTELTGR
ncbi:hypothetical protein RBH38_27435, partial [Escherichia coli]